MLISLHLPKTAGTSFLSSLSNHYGTALLKDYQDLPLHATPYQRHKHAILESIRNSVKSYHDIDCIHGHFLPLKYRFQKSNEPMTFVTWMRDPAERLASQYFYMMRHYTPEKGEKQSLLKKMVEEEWSLERFCLGDELKNTYAKFLWGFPIKRFNFIGIMEHYETDLQYLSENFFNNSLDHYKENINTSTKAHSYFEDQKQKQLVLDFHSQDLKLYQYALKMRQDRLKTKHTPPIS